MSRREDIIVESLGDRARAYVRARIRIDEHGCWRWQRVLGKGGYGIARRSLGAPHGRIECRAHRLAYRAFVGPISTGLLVCHHCDVRSCCNPAHLFLGDNAANMRDMVAKGRSAKGRRQHLAKLRPADVFAVFALRARGVPREQVGRLLGVTTANVRAIETRKTWRHVKVADDLVDAVRRAS